MLSFYCGHAGHGIMHQGRHYMVPKDWDSTSGPLDALDIFGVEVGGKNGALSTMKSATAGVALFDMCRVPLPGLEDEPESPGGHGKHSGGLDGFSNVGVCFATASASPASDGLPSECSPFAKALKKVCCCVTSNTIALEASNHTHTIFSLITSIITVCARGCNPQPTGSAG